MKEKITKKTLLEGGGVKDALVKKALGYDVVETVEEYASADGEIVLTKKKVTKKNVPPDVTALKILLDGEDKKYALLTDEELEEAKQRLIKMLKVKAKKVKEKNSAKNKDK